jgi:hypothetical protein
VCCFSRPVSYVAKTRIFARRVAADRQALVYQMQVQTAEPTAMILPLPVKLPARENDVRFVSLEQYPRFFSDMARLFEPPPPRTFSRSKGIPEAAGAPRLDVVEVGDFVASFVPAMKDFDRLDPRFVIRPEVWKQIPGYDDYGFVVFQLKTPDGKRADVHPMAFSFATRHANRLFFPTVHIHDGKVHATEDFDHQLYAQMPTVSPGVQRGSLPGWETARFETIERMNVPATKGMVHPSDPMLYLAVRGKLRNADMFVPG